MAAVIDGLAREWVMPPSPLHWRGARALDPLALEADWDTPTQLPELLIDVPSFVRAEPLMAEPTTETVVVREGATRREMFRQILGLDEDDELLGQAETRQMTVAEFFPDDLAKPETVEMAAFAEEFTRVEVIAALAERYADTRGCLPTMWTLEKIIQNGLPCRSLLSDPDFMAHLKGYQAGREDFVAHVKQQVQHPGYATKVQASAARASYLGQHQAATILITNAGEAIGHGQPARIR